MEKRNILKNQKGFTLIEIIAVLVILGILAAVAVPRYIDMANDAREKAVQGALAAGGSNASLLYARNLLAANGSAPTMAALATSLGSAEYLNVGDYTVNYSARGTTGITVVVDGPANLIAGVAAASRTQAFSLQ